MTDLGGARVWERLVAEFGPLSRASDLREPALATAHGEGRVLRFWVQSDGYGSGYVGARFLAPDEPPTRELVYDHLDSHRDLVLHRAPTLSAAERDTLANTLANGWERWHDVPLLPPFERPKDADALVRALTRVCPGYADALAALGSRGPWDLGVHERVLARVMADALSQRRADALRATWSAVATLHPTAGPEADVRSSGPGGFFYNLISNLHDLGADLRAAQREVPEALLPWWHAAEEDRFYPRHDGFW